MKEDLTAFTTVFLTGLTAFLAPSFFIIGVLIFSSFVDYFFGIWRAKKTKEKINFLQGIWKTIVKGLFYTLLILAALGADKYFINDLIVLIAGKLEVQLVFTKVVALMLFCVEAVSINRSYKKVKGVSIPSALMHSIKSTRGMIDEATKIKKQIKSE